MENTVVKIIHHPKKIIYGLEKNGLLDWLSEEKYIKITYRLAFGRKLHLDNPKALTEKLNWYKLYYRDPLMCQCVDKYDVRQYVQKTVGKEYLNECFGLWSSISEIDFDALPNQFVLKPTNGSGDVVICKDKSKLDWAVAKKTLTQYSKRSFATKTKEWAYYNLPFRIIGERLIKSSDKNQIKDYKIFCFSGEPQFLFVASERGTEQLKFDFFDTKWNRLPITNAHEHNMKLIKPAHFDEMLEVARKLSKPFPHVRVDLYEEEGRVFFGELTFYHFGGFTRFEPDEWDFKLGEYFDIDSLKKQLEYNMDNNMEKLNGTVIVTYRCNARCSMCNRYKAPSKPEEEINIETIKKLPKMYFTNITGGEPFIRTDLKDIVRELYKKSDRIVISTNGFFTDRIVDLAKEFPQIGIRISIEGLEQTNNEIRGLQDGYNRGYTTLKKLREMGMKDVGFGMTVQDKNVPDLVPLYKISDEMGMEFATASLHNSFYFVEAKNIIHDRPMVAKNFENLINELLRSNSPKKWFRAYFNHGLINYIYGQPRLLPCDMSFDTFFIDPYGDVMPCNGTKDKEVMGNLNTQTWDELWNSPEAEKVRQKVRHCDRQCWMIGSVSPAMHKYIWKPVWWVITHKIKSLFGGKYSMYENKICRDYRDGKVTKEELDKCSTCDMNCVVNNGLSEASKAQLVGRTGEEIVDADIAEQLKER